MTSLTETLADTLAAIERIKQNPPSVGRDAAIQMLNAEAARLRASINGLVEGGNLR